MNFFSKNEVIQSSYKKKTWIFFQSNCFGKFYANSRNTADIQNILELLFSSTFQNHRQKICSFRF